VTTPAARRSFPIFAAFTLLLTGCTDLLVHPAPPAPAGIAVSFNLAQNTSDGGPAEAFAQADQIRLRLVRAGTVSDETTLPFTSAGAETRVSWTVTLTENGESVQIGVDLLRGAALLFRGETEVVLSAGRTIAAEVALVAVPAGISITPESVPELTTIGETVQLAGAVTFATGDVIPGLAVLWSSSDPTVAEVDAQGQVTARASGDAEISATHGGLSGTLNIRVRPPLHVLTVAGGGTGSGVVTSSPDGIQCAVTAGTASGACATSFANGTSVTLTAVPDAGGHTFDGWAGGCTGTGPCTVSITQARSVLASFSEPRYRIVASANPVEGGTISGGGTFPAGEVVTLVATPALGYVFVDWTEGADVVSSSASYTFTAEADRSLFANFELDVPGAPFGLLATAVSQTRIDLSWTRDTANEMEFRIERRTSTAIFGEIATTEAGVTSFQDIGLAPATRYEYRVRACNGSGCSDYSNVASATTDAVTFTISTSPNPAAGGATTGGGTFVAGDSVTVVASPAFGYGFSSWTEGGDTVSTAPAYRFMASADRVLVANFVLTSFLGSDVSAGESHSCGVTLEYVLYCWGSGFFGNLGNGSSSGGTNTPGLVSGGLSVVDVSVGVYHSCAVTVGSQLYCWGEGLHGQLGNGSTNNQNTPTLVAGGHSFVSVSVGERFTCAVTSADQLYCWGRGDSGQLGNSDSTDVHIPTPVSGELDFSSVSAGTTHTCGVTTTSEPYCWGDASFGKLGNGSDVGISTIPLLVQEDFAVSSVAVGTGHTCAVTTANQAYCWGDGDFGKLGNGFDGELSTTPSPVLTNLNFTTITAGEDHTCGVTTTNELYCWGDGRDGQLGDGLGEVSETPVPVSGNLNFNSVDAGYWHTCGTTTQNRLYCWGIGFDGQLGNGVSGSGSQRLTPVPVLPPPPPP
jgi:alpha-tubulin suppressor-like RCC1 family protein